MNVCAKIHECICYNEVDCPLCGALEEIKRLQKQIDDLEREVNENG